MKDNYLLKVTLLILLSIKTHANESFMKITFGSCYKQSDSEQVFNSIREKSPDAFFWLGDIIYADHFSPIKRRAAYNEIKMKPAYTALKKDTIIDGIWDDHDYAHNNASGDYIWKDQSKEVLLEFLETSKNSPVYKRKGIYHKRNMTKGGTL